MGKFRTIFQKHSGLWGLLASVALLAVPFGWWWAGLRPNRKLSESARSSHRYQEVMAQTQNIQPLDVGDHVELPVAKGWVHAGTTPPTFDGHYTVLDIWALW